MLEINQVYVGDNLDLLQKVNNSFIDLHIHSPPYAKMKKYKNFDGIYPDEYVDWYMPRIKEIERTLKNTGTWILNINDCIVDKFRHPYVYDLISEICKKTQFRIVERMIWYKGKSLCHPKRFRDPLEYLFVFAKSNEYYINIDEMRLPYNPISLKRMKNPIKRRFARTERNQNETSYKEWSPNPLGALPNTLIQIGSESRRKSEIHTAIYPEKLINYFIKGFSRPGDLVCDIFSGSGTTCLCAKKLGRNYLGFELSKEYVDESKIRISA